MVFEYVVLLASDDGYSVDSNWSLSEDCSKYAARMADSLITPWHIIICLDYHYHYHARPYYNHNVGGSHKVFQCRSWENCRCVSTLDHCGFYIIFRFIIASGSLSFGRLVVWYVFCIISSTKPLNFHLLSRGHCKM